VAGFFDVKDVHEAVVQFVDSDFHVLENARFDSHLHEDTAVRGRLRRAGCRIDCPTGGLAAPFLGSIASARLQMYTHRAGREAGFSKTRGQQENNLRQLMVGIDPTLSVVVPTHTTR
jgi:hypothetical protein